MSMSSAITTDHGIERFIVMFLVIVVKILEDILLTSLQNLSSLFVYLYYC